MKTIVFDRTKNRFQVDEAGTLQEMRQRCPKFFSDPGLKPDSERFTVYRGQLVVHQVVTLSDRIQRNHLVVYLFLRASLDDKQHKCPDLFCVSGGGPADWSQFDEEAAHRLIDKILDEGHYEYGMALAVS